MSRRKGLKWAFSTHVTMNELWDRFINDEYFEFTRRWLTEVSRVVRRTETSWSLAASTTST